MLEQDGGWAFVEAAKDGYCGYLPGDRLKPPGAPTHIVCQRHTHAYRGPDMKQPPVQRLPFGARIEVRGEDGRWAETDVGFIHATHLTPFGTAAPDPVTVAERFLGVPYLWAGNTGDGIDCSGLVQAAFWAAGHPCPGDSDQQAAALGCAVDLEAEIRRGDLFFWKGHVAIAQAPDVMINATAFYMAVVLEPLQQCLERIAEKDGPLLGRRRV